MNQPQSLPIERDESGFARIPPCRCPNPRCNHDLSSALAGNGADELPQVGDFVVCTYCYQIGQYLQGMALVGIELASIEDPETRDDLAVMKRVIEQERGGS